MHSRVHIAILVLCFNDGHLVCIAIFSKLKLEPHHQSVAPLLKGLPLTLVKAMQDKSLHVSVVSDVRMW